MASARRLAWLTSAFGVLAAVTALLAAATVLSRLDFSVPAGRDLMAACMQLLPSFGAATVAVLALLALLSAVLLRGARAAVGLNSAQRRLSRELVVLAVEQRGGVRYHRIAGDTPQAFCVGMVRPRICVSEGAVSALGERELQAVLAHKGASPPSPRSAAPRCRRHGGARVLLPPCAAPAARAVPRDG